MTLIIYIAGSSTGNLFEVNAGGADAIVAKFDPKGDFGRSLLSVELSLQVSIA